MSSIPDGGGHRKAISEICKRHASCLPEAQRIKMEGEIYAEMRQVERDADRRGRDHVWKRIDEFLTTIKR